MTQESGMITMTSHEVSRYEAIQKLINGSINGTDAAKLMNLSIRQVKRIKARTIKHGVKGIIHQSRGRESNRKISEEKQTAIKDIIKIHYPDFGPTFACEKLVENHNIFIGKETLRQLMIKWNVWKPKPKKQNKEYRTWRPRKQHYGEMQQFDGSYHKWFEERGEPCCLLASIDDATSQITQACFTNHEGVIPAFVFWREYSETKGKPVSIYLDRHSTYKENNKSIFDNPAYLTQFQRAMKDLDIHVIHAYSPQAKGRIERLFGTLQDRLIKELRLANISTIQEANIFLKEVFIPKFNKRFAVIAAKKQSLHKLLNKIDKENLDKIFSIQNTRIVNNDFTVQFKGQWFQLLEIQPTLVLRKDRVLIEERINKEVHISLRDKYLNYTLIREKPQKVVNMHVTGLTKKRQIWKPPINHPWRRPFISPRLLSKVENHQIVKAM